MTRTERTLMTWMLAIGGGAVLAACVAVVAALWVGLSLASQFFFRPADPENATMSVVAKEMKYDECSQQISGKLERHYYSDRSTPIDVTVIAYTPDGPAEGVRLTARMMVPESTDFAIELTSEHAAVFGHPEARRTVSLRRADGQLVFDEKSWPGW